jgi:serine phosphatase RsbU (regulator of sigma subunit)
MQEQRMRVLLVEDDPDDVWIVRNLLDDHWDAPFELVHVGLVSAAVERCAEDRFDVILLDLSLPDSRGLETFFAVHAHAADVPTVILSNFGDEATAVKAVQAGAQDYLVKHEVSDRLLVRSIRYAVERSRRHRAQESLNNTSGKSLAVQEIRQRLSPSRSPTLAGFDVAGAMYAANARAGNYFDYIPIPGDRLAIVVGDVSSHDVGSMLLMSAMRACLRTLAQAHDDVGEILTRANRMLAADNRDFHFITLAMAQIDPRAKSLAYASAGQRGYVLHPGIDTTILDSTSLPLSVRADTVIRTAAPIRLHAGDLLTFFTTGAVKAESPDHGQFGVARALQSIRSERERPASQIIDRLHKEIAGFCGSQPPLDDITIIVVKVLAE